MAEESEKRFTAVMDKLFHAPPKPKSSSPATSDSGVQSRGKKRSWSALAVVEKKSRSSLVEELQNQSGTVKAVQPPMCRPWDRSDFFRRLATFKSMTWFAKPQAVSAINCARRGWVNVDFDTIACEACGSRLLISTPQSWTQQQVENTALVFSLKLDSGHKLLCPWVDNICDEGLTQFPPVQTADLVEDYKTRCSALLQLLALPSISSSAIAYMRSPQLEQFLKEHSISECSESAESSGTNHVGYEPGTVSSVSYYQAQKLISLCGWEPHPLPYIVGCKEGQKRSISDASPAEISNAVSSGQSQSMSAFSLSTDGSTWASNDATASAELQFDPNSVVLDCRLCGARVGLWAFSSIPRPVEFFRLVGHTEVNEKSDLDHHNGHGSGSQFSGSESQVTVTDVATTRPKSLGEGPSKLNLTIAGGPPPTKQNYRAVVSLPIVGRNLRARFSTDSSLKGHLTVSENATREGASVSIEANSVPDNPSTSSQIVVKDSYDTDIAPGNECGMAITLGVGEKCGSQAESDPSSTPEDNIATANGKYSDNVTESLAEAHNHAPDSQGNRQGELNVLPINHEPMPSRIEKGLQPLPSENAMELDPIRQHRPFCPWITSIGNSAPGWQQTLSALQRHNEFSYPLPENTSSSLIEVDDPIESIRKLFTSPSSKRSKLAHPS